MYVRLLLTSWLVIFLKWNSRVVSLVLNPSKRSVSWTDVSKTVDAVQSCRMQEELAIFM